MDQRNNQGTHGEFRRPRFLPPLSLSPFLRRRKSFQGQKQQHPGDGEAATATDMEMKMKKISTYDPLRRRNGACDMLMPAEYFAALPHLEMLNVRYHFGLDSLEKSPGMVNHGIKHEDYLPNYTEMLVNPVIT